MFSPLAPERAPRSGIETIYEGYLVHYGRSRLFAPADEDTALLLGDYLYAHGLVRVAETGNVAAVADLAELISLCAQARADGRDGDAAAWAATAALLGGDGLEAARDALRSDGSAGVARRGCAAPPQATARSTRAGCTRPARRVESRAMTAAFLQLLAQTTVQEAQEKTAAEEGADIVLSMLVVGLVFLAVIAIGELIDRRHRSSQH